VLSAADIFVFAGAGASYCRPAELALFGQVRDHILVQLGLDDFARNDSKKRRLAEGLVPEPFMLSLVRAEVPVSHWLSSVFRSPQPNAVHTVLAHLAAEGAKVWTVNFDDCIERAAPRPLSVVAWPARPSGPADLLKPHGTIGGPLIVDTEQVLRGVDPDWLGRLRNDVAGRTVVFIGYRGRDLDLRPNWPAVLRGAAKVLWFDKPVTDDATQAEQDYKRRLLHELSTAGRLCFPDPEPPPQPGLSPNPSWDFVRWAEREGLATAPPDLVEQLHERRTERPLPALPPIDQLTVAAVRELLGDTTGARRTYLRATLRGPRRRAGARSLVQLTMNHGSRATAAVLSLGVLVPAVGPLADKRDRFRRKHLNILFNTGRHWAVARKTEYLRDDDVSTLRLLRAAALRLTADLDTAAALAADAFRQACQEQHPVRIANAAFQHTYALMWAGRLDEARAVLADELQPHAEIAANRWVAWTDFLTGALLVHAGRHDDALQAIGDAVVRFEGHTLVDGVVSSKLIELTALRGAGDDAGFARSHRQVLTLLGDPVGTYYARGSRFTAEALAFEEAEHARCRTGDLDESRRGYCLLAGSPWPVHRALGQLGLAALAAQQGDHGRSAAVALADASAATAGRVRARGVVAEAERLAGDLRSRSGTAGRSVEVLFP
jgi:hypothetical protein